MTFKAYTPEEYVSLPRVGDDFEEVIIHPCGTIWPALPSHTEYMIREYLTVAGISRETLWERIQVHESPIHWLTDKLGYIPVWYKFYIVPEGGITPAQQGAIEVLRTNGIILKTAMALTS